MDNHNMRRGEGIDAARAELADRDADGAGRVLRRCGIVFERVGQRTALGRSQRCKQYQVGRQPGPFTDSVHEADFNANYGAGKA